MRNDPLQSFLAQGEQFYPVGTMDELQKHNLPARVFPSCAEPSFDGSVKGCPYWHDCTMSYRGLPSSEGGGPRAHCWERIKSAGNGGGIVRNAQPCFWGVAQQEVARDNDEVLRVIADEGEEYETLTEIADPAKGRDQFGALVYDRRLLKLKVPPFQRLGQEQKLAAHELRASIMRREKEKQTNERAAKALGVEGVHEPLDRRSRRGGGGSPAKD